MRFVIFILFMAFTPTITAQGLDAYQWKNRILLLVDVNSDSHALTSQLVLFTADKKGLVERDLIIFRATPEKVYLADGTKADTDPKKVYKDAHLDAAFSGVVLLGKDGGVKMQEPFEVTTQKIFDLIDGMPMRRREIRESGKQ